MVSKEIYGELISMVLLKGTKKATQIISEKEVVKATFRGKRDGRDSRKTIIVTVGAPNFSERSLIKKVKETHGKFYPHIHIKLDKKKK